MVMPITVQISADADGGSWTDLSPAVKVRSIRMGGQAGPQGEAGTGFGFDFEDLAAAFDLPARRRVRLLVGVLGDTDFLLAQGRVTDKAIARRSPPVEPVRGFDVNLADANSHLQGIPVHRWVRPAETDVARITALADDFLSGDPRPSTNLSQFFLSASSPINLPAKTYDATNPAGVVADVCSQTRKRFFITVDDEVFYDADTSTAYAADLSVTDVDPDPSFGSWEFAPIWSGPAGNQDGTEFYSGLRLIWGELAEDSVHDSDGAAEAAHDFWEEVINGGARTEAEANAELSAILDERKVEELRFSFAIQLTDAELLLIKYGQTFSFRAAAAGMLTPVTVRCSKLTWNPISPGLWRADIEAGFPRKLAPRLSRGTPRSLLPSQPIESEGGSSIFAICHHTSFYIGTWDTDNGLGPGPADLLIPASAGGTSLTIGPGTGNTDEVPGWYGSAVYTVTTPAVFPLGYDGTAVLSGRIVVPAHSDWTGTGPATLTIEVTDESPASIGLLLSIAAAEDLDNFILEQNVTYSFKLRVGTGGSNAKIWRILDPEPVAYDPADWGSLGQAPNLIGASVSWTDVSAPVGTCTPPGAFTVDQLQWCYESQAATAFSGSTYGPAFIAVADGLTSAFSLPAYPGTGYTPGTLLVYVDGVWQPVTETDTTAPGQFDFTPAVPDEEDVIYATWRVPS